MTGYAPFEVYVQSGVQFNPNDGIETTQILNVLDFTSFDYIVVTDTVNGSEKIASRWFVTERTRKRRGQSLVRMSRDVMADYKEPIKNAIAYIDRGYVPNSNPLIYNPEGGSYNQIKTGEILLKDKTNTAWIVGYLASNFFGDTPTDKTITINREQAYTDAFGTTDEMIASIPGSSLSGTPFVTGYEKGRLQFVSWVSDEMENKKFTLNPESGVSTGFSDQTEQAAYTFYTLEKSVNWLSSNMPTSEQICKAIKDDISGPSIDNNIMIASNGKIVRVGSGNDFDYYQFTYDILDPSNITVNTSDESSTSNKNELVNNLLASATENDVGTGGYDNNYTFYAVAQRAQGRWVKITKTLSGTLKAGAPILDDAPYYMIAIPINKVVYKYNGVGTTMEDTAFKIASSLIRQYGSFVYDMQILPYFPDPTLVDSQGVLNFQNVPDESFTYLTSPTTLGGNFIYFCKKSTFSQTLSYTQSASTIPKISSQTDFVRINSPNYASSFDFSVDKNNGVTGYKANCTYKPYQPYIHIAPIWGGVYGDDYGDARGLICSGEFSLPIVSNAWTEYQIQNKNYQLIFNRQIESMDLQNQYAGVNDVMSAITGTIGAAVSGGLTGAAAGGAGGAVAGSIIAGTASAVGGMADVSINRRLREDARDAANDQFSYNLGNIKARPNSLTRVGALNANNKLFPFLEFYSCTSQEKDALKKRMQYEGYSLGVVGRLADYLKPNENTYIRARIINIEGINDDTDLINAISNRLMGGVYFTKGVNT